ncbi:MbcA/ParS/Xre antitoxin family protein [Chitinophaga cymbidii]|uniref:Antitoxin Xre/MbcA/ParS-like toxin-binding domain-containing protein n=1 Tax=Chitinophaga cymbidii TaxID=1096750 RepID=A0A512RFV7_9BACT|nr:MbcA/ParS/Xre antitoxin family protein [Chitinophaga cymbidii]GEP94528.1 hypothetical protein CCY01nite_07880 [Chitinophaga cymbidii]
MKKSAYSLDKIAPRLYTYFAMGYNAWVKAMNNQGIKSSDLSQLQLEMGIEFKDLRNALNLPANFLNTSGEAPLPAHAIDNLHELVHLYVEGYNVWEDREKFNKWMTRKNPYLFDATPIEACMTRIGLHEVRNEIDRVKFGIS